MVPGKIPIRYFINRGVYIAPLWGYLITSLKNMGLEVLENPKKCYWSYYEFCFW